MERLCTFQYGLVSLIPELLRHMDDVGSPNLDNCNLKPMDENSGEDYANKRQVYDCGFPLRVFGKVKLDL